MQKKTLIIGAGFNALATAYHLKKLNRDVKIIFEKNIKGVLGSVEIEGMNFDLGYQFFDGLDQETNKFIRELFSNEDLYDFSYEASTFTNNILYQDHAIPYWKSYGLLFVIKAFIFYLKNFIKSFFIKNVKEINNLSDLFNRLPPNIREILSSGCKKNYQIDAAKLHYKANEMSTFTTFRQTLFNDTISNFLKLNSKFFDEHLASRRKSNNSLDTISLYPKGKNMEIIIDKLIANLKMRGVIFEQFDLENFNLFHKENYVLYKDEQFEQVVITSNLTNIQKYFKIKTENTYEHYISQVFIYFTVKNVLSNYQYIQVNDLDLYCSRISNCSLYSKLTDKNNKVLIAEIPLTKNSEPWNNDQKLKDIAWDEIVKCGIVNKNEEYISAKLLKVSKTFPVPMMNFYDFLSEINLILNNSFRGKIVMLGQGIFTRHKFVKELLKKFN